MKYLCLPAGRTYTRIFSNDLTIPFHLINRFRNLFIVCLLSQASAYRASSPPGTVLRHHPIIRMACRAYPKNLCARSWQYLIGACRILRAPVFCQIRMLREKRLWKARRDFIFGIVRNLISKPPVIICSNPFLFTTSCTNPDRA